MPIEAPKAIAPLIKNAITILWGTTFSESLTSSPTQVRLPTSHIEITSPAPTHVARTIDALGNVSRVLFMRTEEVKVPTNAQADASSPMPHETPLLFHPPTFSKFAKTNDAVLRGDRYTKGTKNTKKKQTWWINASVSIWGKNLMPRMFTRAATVRITQYMKVPCQFWETYEPMLKTSRPWISVAATYAALAAIERRAKPVIIPANLRRCQIPRLRRDKPAV